MIHRGIRGSVIIEAYEAKWLIEPKAEDPRNDVID